MKHNKITTSDNVNASYSDDVYSFAHNMIGHSSNSRFFKKGNCNRINVSLLQSDFPVFHRWVLSKNTLSAGYVN